MKTTVCVVCMCVLSKRVNKSPGRNPLSICLTKSAYASVSKEINSPDSPLWSDMTKHVTDEILTLTNYTQTYSEADS